MGDRERYYNQLIRIHFSEVLPEHGQCRLPQEAAHHVAHVMRCKVGDALTLFDGRGGVREARITAVARGGVDIQVGPLRLESRESPLSVVLVQALSSGDRMDYTVQKSVELGVQEIHPVISARSVVRLSGARAERRVQHWQSVAISACEQCGRNVVPPVMPLLTLSQWLATSQSPALKLILAPEADLRLAALPRPVGPVWLLAGPEGGFTPEELADAEVAGFRSLSLGPRILRTETAAVAGLAALQTLWGDF